MARSFDAQVDDWIANTDELLEVVVKESTQRLVTKMQTPIAKGGNLPVDTGFLRASLVGQINAPVTLVTFNPNNETKTYNAQPIFNAIAQYKAGDDLHFSYTANYAGFIHDGARGRTGRPWVLLEVQNWQQIVNGVVRELA